MRRATKRLLWLAVVAGLVYGGYRTYGQWEVGPWLGIPPDTPDTYEARAQAPGTECVDINRASYRELRRIRYINPVRARTILETRLSRPFRDLDDLTRVKGIGPFRVEAIRSQGLACVRSP